MQTAIRYSNVGRCTLRASSRTTLSAVPLGRFAHRQSILQAQSGPLRAQRDQKQPAPPSAEDDDLPPWVRREKERQLQAQEGSTGLSWPLLLLFSIFTAIAAVGSIFEYIDRNAIFGVIEPDSPLWAPILLFFAVTGFPTAGYLFIQGVNGFNAEAERQDKLDGYL